MQKSPRLLAPKYLRSAIDRPCDACGIEDDTIVFAHARYGAEAGTGRKPDDWRGAFLCARDHADQEDHPGPRWWITHVDPMIIPAPGPLIEQEHWFNTVWLPERLRVYEEWKNG